MSEGVQVSEGVNKHIGKRDCLHGHAEQGMPAGRLTRQKPAGVSQEDALACAHIQDLEEVHA